MVITYLTDVVPFREYINPDAPQHGFLFGDKDGPWKTERQTKAFIRETSLRLGFRMTTQDYRHIAKAIDRKFIRPSHLGEEEDDSEDEDEEDEANDVMAGHGSRVANAVYGRDMDRLDRLSARSITVFRKISDRWQRWLGLVPRASRDEGAAVDDGDDTEPNRARDRVHGKMKELFGADYKFHSKEQEEGVMAVLDGISPLMIVLATGGGKTLMIQLPALLDRDDKTTVVVTPLVALGDQLVKRMQELNIDCIKWNRVWTRKAKVVVVVAETTLTRDFRCFLAGLDRSNELSRVVYDEAHKLVTDVGYRPKLAEMKSIALSVQQVFLTATFPPSMREEFEEMLVTPGLVEIRGRTNRPTFRYEVREVDDAESDAVAWAKSRVKEGGDGKVVLFCTSRQRCDRLAEELCCGKYYSTAPNKREDLKKWESGESRVLVATGALGAGVDVSKVVDVVHVGKPWTYKDFSQESGRGGRANETVVSVVFIEPWELRRGEGEKTLDEITLQEYLTTKGCRRKPGSRFLDGQDLETTCAGVDGERCDNCRAEYSMTPGGKRRLWREERAEEEKKRQKIYDERVLAVRQDVQNCVYKQTFVEQTLDRLQVSCPVCWLYEGWGGSEHAFEDCDVLTGLLKMRYGEVRGEVKYWDKFGCCYDCSRPCDWCDDFTSQRKCGYKDVIVPTVLAAYVSRDTRWFKCIQAVERRDFKDIYEFIKWMCGRLRIWGKNCTKAFVVFVNLIDERSE